MAIHPNDLSSSNTNDVIITLHPDDDLSSSPVNPTQKFDDYPNRDARSWRCIMLIVLVFTLGFGVLIFFNTRLVIKTPNLAIDSLTLSNFSLSSHPNQISADWNVQMSLKAVDSHGYFKFTNIRFLISTYSDKISWDTDLTSFHVSPKNPPMHFGKEFSVWSDNVDDSAISDIRQQINAGKVKFNVGFVASVKPTYNNGWVRTSLLLDDYWWIMNCENVELVFGTSDVSKAQMLNAASSTCNFVERYCT